MSVFRKFKLPQLLRKGPPASEIGEDIPRFKCSELPLKQRLGQGSFGDVYTAEYRASGDTKCHTVVVKKMLQVLDQEEKKLFYKEVRLLNDLQHPLQPCNYVSKYFLVFLLSLLNSIQNLPMASYGFKKRPDSNLFLL